MRRLRDWCYGRWASARRRSRLSLELLGTTRHVLISAGFPIRKQFLVLRCASGSEVSGLFSEFAVVLGALEHYERWRAIYAGFEVDFRIKGHHDPALGNNWWRQLFEPIHVGSEARGSWIRTRRPHDVFAYRIAQLSRRQGGALIDRDISAESANSCRRMPTRATTSQRLRRRRPLSRHRQMDECAPRAVQRRSRSYSARNGIRPEGRFKVFVATDETAPLHARPLPSRTALPRDVPLGSRATDRRGEQRRQLLEGRGL